MDRLLKFNFQMNLQPLSLNPEIQSFNKLSPVNMLCGKIKQHEQALQAENKELQAHIAKLNQQLRNYRQKNAALNVQADRHQRKLQTWRKCFEQANQQYCQKIQKLQRLSSLLKIQQQFKNNISLKAQKTLQNTLMMNRVKNHSLANGLIKINSIILKKQRHKRKQALSLTHLHKS